MQMAADHTRGHARAARVRLAWEEGSGAIAVAFTRSTDCETLGIRANDIQFAAG